MALFSEFGLLSLQKDATKHAILVTYWKQKRVQENKCRIQTSSQNSNKELFKEKTTTFLPIIEKINVTLHPNNNKKNRNK